MNNRRDLPYRLKGKIIRMAAPYLSDASYLKLLFRHRVGYKLDLVNPKTFNEKLNWLKLYDRNPMYSKLADKFEVKQYVGSIIGNQYVVPNYGAYEKFEDIDFTKLPEKFVLKATHDSSGATICTNREALDFLSLKKHFDKLLHRNYYYHGREWPYKNIQPRIIADMYLEDCHGEKLLDYKFWCFNGVPLYMYCTIKSGDVFENFYDMEFNPVEISHGFKRLKPEFDRPKNFELMKELAQKLAAGLPFVRIDLFEVNGQVYFGEYTFYDWGGMKPFTTYNQDLYLGSLLDVDKIRKR